MVATHEGSIPALLKRARAGDAAALDRLFTACRNYVAVVARAQMESGLKAKADASDLVQCTLLEAYRGFDGFHGATEAEWLAWLRKIVAHNAADFVRAYRGAAKRQVGREVPLAGPASDGGNGGNGREPAARLETPSQELLRKERALCMADALMHLPEDYREVVLLRNVERLPFDEVAARLGRSRPAAQMLWLRALRKLQDLLGEHP
jgi:RNA polymerase sigma-70 factor (ECF subfamily)